MKYYPHNFLSYILIILNWDVRLLSCPHLTEFNLCMKIIYMVLFSESAEGLQNLINWRVVVMVGLCNSKTVSRNMQ